jgi:hypothetical protein
MSAQPCVNANRFPFDKSAGDPLQERMKQIPKTKDALVLRADFSDQAAWEAICTII